MSYASKGITKKHKAKRPKKGFTDYVGHKFLYMGQVQEGGWPGAKILRLAAEGMLTRKS